ncbi:MAG: cobalt-precorrin-6A reductase [Rhodospirillales bacterium]|nr:cobalt-precorrin-6A reductase [Rhodospirillales bacterium]
MAEFRLLILGGTTEGRGLARAAIERFGDRLDVLSSLAGVVDDPVLPPGRVRVGGFGGVEGLRRFLRDERIDAMIDATHPFARHMQANAAAACAADAVPRCRLSRPPWAKQDGDRWIAVGSPADAAAAVPALGRRVFLALGARDLAPFLTLADTWLLLRGINPPDRTLTNGRFLQARGPFDLAAEEALLRDHRIDVVVSRQSGGTGAGAKIEAARRLGLPVVMIERPPPPAPPLVATIADAMAWLEPRIVLRAEALATGAAGDAV